MVRRLLVLVVILASVGLTACASGGGRRVKTAPQAPAQTVVLQTPDCFDESFLAQYAHGVTEAFSNECPAPVQGIVEEIEFFNNMPIDGERKPFCQFVLRAGGKKMGPALWAQATVSNKGASTKQLVIHGDYISTVTNRDQTFALAQRQTVHLNTQAQGVTKFVCGGSR